MYVLSAQTQTALQGFRERVAELNGVSNLSAPFEVAPQPEQRLIEAYQQATDFLKKINIVLVRDAHGQKLGLGSTTPIASTTDTRIQPRRPTTLGELEAVDDYLCTQTDFDVGYDWRVIDNWSSLTDFQVRLANLSVKRIAQDRQRIGFNGTHRAKTSNKQLYPNLQDVNVGWLEKIRQYSPERHLKDIKIGKNQEFKNLDALVETAKNELIGEQHRNADDLVVITTSSLITDKALQLINQNHSPTEQTAANTLYQRKLLGTMPTDTPSYFPTGSILITSYDNLSIYQQRGTHRRHIKDEPEWNRTADYQSINESYVVEDYSKVVLFDNVSNEE